MDGPVATIVVIRSWPSVSRTGAPVIVMTSWPLSLPSTSAVLPGCAIAYGSGASPTTAKSAATGRAQRASALGRERLESTPPIYWGDRPHRAGGAEPGTRRGPDPPDR